MRNLIPPFILAMLVIFPAFGWWEKQTIKIDSCLGVQDCKKGDKAWHSDLIVVPRKIVIPNNLPLDAAAQKWLGKHRPGATLKKVTLYVLPLEDAND